MSLSIPVKKQKVLVVDDAKEIRILLKAYLEAEGYLVIEASTGHEGVQMLRNDLEIKVVLLDIKMPGMDGFTTIKHLADDRKHRDLRICFVTGLADMAMVQSALEYGIRDYVVKPIDREILIKKVRHLFEAKPSSNLVKKK